MNSGITSSAWSISAASSVRPRCVHRDRAAALLEVALVEGLDRLEVAAEALVADRGGQALITQQSRRSPGPGTRKQRPGVGPNSSNRATDHQ